jgi:hypothetical protein
LKKVQVFDGAADINSLVMTYLLRHSARHARQSEPPPPAVLFQPDTKRSRPNRPERIRAGVYRPPRRSDIYSLRPLI